jgi:mannose-1-phosphate guanylyltransferase / mannose-6-phosphate isomerase
MMKSVILAGGSGTRMWPLSTSACPKQFLNLDGQGDMLTQTMRRCQQTGLIDEQFVITGEQFATQVAAMMMAFSPSFANNVILEPNGRNTAPAVLLTAKWLEHHHHASLDDVILILPSDHVIQDLSQLTYAFKKAQERALAGDIVTFGIVPHGPETGYGYIKAGGDALDHGYASIARFAEKPDRSTAKAYLAEGGYFWNAGMFAFTLRTLYTEMRKHYTEALSWIDRSYEEILSDFDQMTSISFDYAVMERTQKAVVIPLEANWSDVGSWDSLYEILDKDDYGNAVQGSALILNAHNNLVINHRADQQIAVVEMSNMILIQNDEGLLVMPRGSSQQVRQVIEAMKQTALQKTISFV